MSMMNYDNIVSFFLRLVALSASIVAAILMVTSHDSTTVLNIKFEAKFNNSTTFKYFVIIYSIASAYSLMLLFFRFRNSLWRLVLVSDLVIMCLVISSISAAISIGLVGKQGDSHAGWLPVCSQVPKFCDHVTGALISGFIAALFYFKIILFSLHKFINLLIVKG